LLDTHRVHRSLLRPPLFVGVERELFFTAAGGAVPVIGYGEINLRTGLVLAVYVAAAYVVCHWLTAKDHSLLSLTVASLRYADHYDPLPQPGLKARRPLARKT
jgi:type IV secretory pathway TrbD component